ncbi:sensor histidine kinase [Frigoribacterium sp. 2-23]|uniref:sensor histidine kinase n=1 Tax=Frigoribacterium sp. 2-23 TaxID=3415006 RepID=UPI003C6FBD49
MTRVLTDVLSRMLPRSLTGRIVQTTIAVAVIAVVAVSIAGFQLVRQESLMQTALVLRTSAQAIAASPADEREALATELAQRSDGRIQIAFGGTGTGTVSAPGLSLPPRLERRLATETQVSARDVSGGHTLLAEAVPLPGGGSVIAIEDASILHGDRVLDRFAVALLVGLAVAVGLGIVLGRFTTRPLRAIAATATRLARGDRGLGDRGLGDRGPGDRSLGERGPGTVDASIVGRSGSRASGGRATGTGAAGTGAAAREVAEIQNALEVLDTELARSESAQREFLLSISHEIRTPLAALRGYADALGDGLVPGHEVPRVAGVMRAETERLDAFVTDLLALARLEADDFVVRPEPFDVVGLVDQAVEAWSGRAATVGAVIRRESTVEDVVIVSDPHRVRQLVDGLVENSLRVSPPGGLVTVGVSATQDDAVVSVTDDGPGLDASDLPHAFVRGALRDRHQGDRPVGTGLGLSIAARLAGRLGATVEARPRAAGAEFRVSLPRGPHPTVRAARASSSVHDPYTRLTEAEHDGSTLPS